MLWQHAKFKFRIPHFIPNPLSLIVLGDRCYDLKLHQPSDFYISLALMTFGGRSAVKQQFNLKLTDYEVICRFRRSQGSQDYQNSLRQCHNQCYRCQHF